MEANNHSWRASLPGQRLALVLLVGGYSSESSVQSFTSKLTCPIELCDFSGKLCLM